MARIAGALTEAGEFRPNEGTNFWCRGIPRLLKRTLGCARHSGDTYWAVWRRTDPYWRRIFTS